MRTRTRPEPYVHWSVEIDGVALCDDRSGSVRKLSYPHAAIWDFVARGDAESAVVTKVAAIASLQPQSAKVLVRETIEELQQAGFLTPGGLNG